MYDILKPQKSYFVMRKTCLIRLDLICLDFSGDFTVAEFLLYRVK